MVYQPAVGPPCGRASVGDCCVRRSRRHPYRRSVPARGRRSARRRSFQSRISPNRPSTICARAVGECDLRVDRVSSLKFCIVAEGRADIYPRLSPTSEWDTAAGHAILLAAGGRVDGPDGAPLAYCKPAFLNPRLLRHRRLGSPADCPVAGKFRRLDRVGKPVSMISGAQGDCSGGRLGPTSDQLFLRAGATLKPAQPVDLPPKPRACWSSAPVPSAALSLSVAASTASKSIRLGKSVDRSPRDRGRS